MATVSIFTTIDEGLLGESSATLVRWADAKRKDTSLHSASRLGVS
jgi:hypothetical protein